MTKHLGWCVLHSYFFYYWRKSPKIDAIELEKVGKPQNKLNKLIFVLFGGFLNIFRNKTTKINK